MINTFITDFKASPLIERICSKYNVIMIWLSGSQAIGLTDHLSDYDLGVLVADQVSFSKTEKTPEFYIYKKEQKDVHCIYNSFEDVAANLCNGQLAPYRYLGWAQFKCIQPDRILYINPKYATVVAKLIENKDLIAENSIRTFLTLLEPQLRLTKTIHHVMVVKWGKMLSHLCWCVEELQNKPHNYSYLMELKRAFARQEPPKQLPLEIKLYAFENVKAAQAYLTQHPVRNSEVDLLIDNIIKELNE